MAATVSVKFWDGNSWNDPAKIVFTSPHIDSPATAGVRSHVLPDLMEIALWYEDASNMYRITDLQEEPDTVFFKTYATVSGAAYVDEGWGDTAGTNGVFGTGIPEGIKALTLVNVSGTSDVSDWPDKTIELGDSEYTYPILRLYSEHTRDLDYNAEYYWFSYFKDSWTSFPNSVTVKQGREVTGGTDAKNYPPSHTNSAYSDFDIDLTFGAGVTVYLDSTSCDFGFHNSIVYEMTLGEAYNCYLTAWDDDTHSSTDNTVISGSHYRCAAMSCYVRGSKTTPIDADNSTYGTIIEEPVTNQILYGNTYKYDITDPLRYNSIDDDVEGAFLLFKPWLYNITSAIPFGIYDFVTTFHYQYT